MVPCLGSLCVTNTESIHLYFNKLGRLSGFAYSRELFTKVGSTNLNIGQEPAQCTGPSSTASAQNTPCGQNSRPAAHVLWRARLKPSVQQDKAFFALLWPTSCTDSTISLSTSLATLPGSNFTGCGWYYCGWQPFTAEGWLQGGGRRMLKRFEGGTGRSPAFVVGVDGE